MSTLVCSENNVKGKHVCCTSKGRDWKVKDMHRHLSWLQFMASVMNNNECNGCVGCTTTDVAHQYCNWQFSTLMSSTAIGARWGSFCSDACEKLHSGGRDQKGDNWMDGKKETQYIVSTSARVMQAIRAVTEFYGPWFVPTFKNKIFPTWETPWLLEKRPQQWAFKYHFRKCALNIFATADAKGLEDLMLFSWAGNNWPRKP